jgi:predicted ferric reductase
VAKGWTQQIFWGCAMNLAAAAAGSQDLWFVSRASGLVLLVLFSVVVVLGVAARMGSSPKNWPRFVIIELHRTLALFAIALLALHVVTAILDPFVTIGWAATILPFLSPYRAWQIGLGTLAVDIAGAVLITSLLRVRLGFRAWRIVHWLAYVAWPVAFVHSITAGTDLTIWWVALTEWACAAAVAVAVMARILFAVRGGVVRGAPTATGIPPEIPDDFFSRERAHR